MGGWVGGGEKRRGGEGEGQVGGKGVQASCLRGVNRVTGA